jgi:glycosyltransferase involved in cell wall biosynthesis
VVTIARAPLVSVIVPVYDDPHGLRACLRALAAQTYPADRFEVVVVDNGSRTDLRDVVAAFPGFRIEREEAPGSYAARNRGIEASKGEILAFTDSDCLPEPAWLEAGVRALAAAPDCGAVGGAIRMFAANPERITAFDLHDLVWGMPQRVYVQRYGLAATGNLFARRSTFDRVGPFDPGFRSCGDCEWSFRMTASALRLGYAADAQVRHSTRSSFAQFVRRRRRIAGGYHRLGPILERSYPDKDFEIPRGFRHSWNRIRRSMGHELLRTRRRKLAFACVELLLYAVNVTEGWRLRRGGEPIRG